MKMRIKEIEVDGDIYPRIQRSPSAVDSYVESLKAGAVFPPITVQRVTDNGETKTISLDGSHRLEAYNTYNKEVENQLEQTETDVSQFFGEEKIENSGLSPILEIEVQHWKDKILDKQEWLEEMRIASYQLNMRHGVRMSDNDLAFVAGRIVDGRSLEGLSGIVKELAERFGKSPSRMSELIGDKIRRRRATRDSLIIKLRMEGWTNPEIGEVVGLDFSTVSGIFGNLDTEVIKGLHYNKGVSPEEIADTYRMDTAAVWSILLEDKDDLTRYKLFGNGDPPTPFNVWNFAKRDTRLGLEYPGNIPGQIVLNTLYYYTKQGDFVVDPMAGGGSTIDACLVMGRECRAFDNNPDVVEKRKDIILRDIEDKDFLDEGFGNKKPCDLVFLDPPYYNMVFDQGKTIDEFYDFVRLLCKKSLLSLKTGGHVAFLMADMIKTDGDYCLSGESYKIFTEFPFEYVDHISAPSDANVRVVERKKGERRLIARNRDIYVFRK